MSCCPPSFRSPLLRALRWLAIVWPSLVWAAAPGPDSPTLRKIRDAGVITLGYRAASAPFSYLDSQRHPIGYSMDICQRVVDAVRLRLALPALEVRTMVVGSATRMPLVSNGTVDLECGVTTHTPERSKSVAFSVTTFVAASRLLSKTSAPVRTLEDLRGKTVVSTLATTSMQYLADANLARRLEMKILAGQDDIESFRMVGTGRAAAYAMDDVLLKSLLATAPNAADFMIADEALTAEPYAIAMKPGDPAFKQLVDGVITGLYRSGEIEALYRKWFLSPIPPKGVNLQLPMSEALKRVLRNPTDASDPRLYR